MIQAIGLVERVLQEVDRVSGHFVDTSFEKGVRFFYGSNPCFWPRLRLERHKGSSLCMHDLIAAP